MKGTNELTINQDTMQEALTEYLTKRLPSTPIRITSVAAKPVTRGGYGESESYVVTFESTAPTPAQTASTG